MFKFFRVPFALSGDRTPVPDDADVNGFVSYIEGYGIDYQRPKTDTLSKNIERDKMNELFFDITNAIAEIQAFGVPDFITSALNGGSPFVYSANAIVRYSGQVYISLSGANTALPTDDTKWALMVARWPIVPLEVFGPVVRDGITDNQTTLALAGLSGKAVWLGMGELAHTGEIAFANGTKFLGSGNFFWQFRANPPANGQCTMLKYTGVGGANTAAVRMSRVAVGVLPIFQPDESQTLRGCGIRDLVIDGGLADFALYSARAGNGNVYDKITVTGSKRQGYFFGEFFSGRLGELIAVHTGGSAGSIGDNIFGWSTGNVCNAMQCDTLLAFKCGVDQTYNEISAPTSSVGWILKPSRTCEFTNVIGELCDGPGMYWSPRAGPNRVVNYYAEDNTYFDAAADAAGTGAGTASGSGRAAQPWGLYGYNRRLNTGDPAVDGDTVQPFFDGVFGAAPGGRRQHIKLTGDKTGAYVQEPSEAWVFGNMYGIFEIDSDFNNYTLSPVQAALIDSNPTANITRYLPIVGEPEAFVGTSPTLYAASAKTGDGSGRSAGNRTTLPLAIEMARQFRGVTTIDISAQTSTLGFGAVLSGKGITRKLTLDGGGAARWVNSAGLAAELRAWQSPLIIANMLRVERTRSYDSTIIFQDCPIITMGGGADVTVGPAINADNSLIFIRGTSALNLTGAGGAPKQGVGILNGSEVSFDNAAAGSIVGYAAASAIVFDSGSGTLRVSLTTATAVWAAAASVTRNAGGGAGVVLAPNGLNP